MSTKAEFYDSLEGREYTITILMEIHGLSRPTVTKWLKDGDIVAIPGTWPPRYTLEYRIKKDDNGNPAKVAVSEGPDPSILDGYLQKLLKPETALDLAKMFRDVRTSEDIRKLIKGLDDIKAVANHYDKFFMEDGLI